MSRTMVHAVWSAVALFGWGKRRGRERWIRADYRDLPESEWTEDEHHHFVQHQSEADYWADWEAWSRDTVPHPHIRHIRRGVLELAREAAKASLPDEFAAVMRVVGDTIEELVLLPGTVQGDEHAILPLYQAPVDTTIKGTLHSHPDPHPYPSDADLELFAYQGIIHIILGTPFGPGDWRAYDHTGQPVSIDVIE